MASKAAGMTAAAGRWLVTVEPLHRRQMSKVAAKTPDALSLYRDLLRTVRAFPAEPMLDLNAGGAEQGFAVAASIQIRYGRGGLHTWQVA
jgi:hypothetical protein